MDANDVAAFMQDDSSEKTDEAAVVDKGRPTPNRAFQAQRPLPPPPPKAKGEASKVAAPGFTMRFEKTREELPDHESDGHSAAAIRAMLEEEEPVSIQSQKRFEPMDSGLESRVEESTSLAYATGGGVRSLQILGTETRAENAESEARTFACYRLQVERDMGPYLIYRRYRQFEDLYRRCRQHGLHVERLPDKQRNWFGLRGVDARVTEERIPQLQNWFAQLLALAPAADFHFLQLWLSPIQIGDLKPSQYLE